MNLIVWNMRDEKIENESWGVILAEIFDSNERLENIVRKNL